MDDASEINDDLHRRVRALRHLRTAARVVAVLAALIAVAWLVAAFAALAGSLDISPELAFVMAALSALLAGMAAHVGWVLAPRGVATLESRLDP